MCLGGGDALYACISNSPINALLFFRKVVMICITPTIAVAPEYIRESFIRSSGPGGQNVNKVATGVQLRFDAQGCGLLAPDALQRLSRLAGSKFTASGEVVIEATRFRSQKQNRDDACARLAQLVAKALAKPKKRKKTRPLKKAREKRLKNKRRQSERKKERVKVFIEE